MRRALLLALCLLTTAAHAQQRPIDMADYDTWQAINGQVLSHDGHFLAYGLFSQEGDGVVVIRDLRTNTEQREPAGQLPAPPPDDPTAEAPPPPRAIKLVFTADSANLIFLAYPTRAEVEKAKTDKTLHPHEELVIYDLAKSAPTRVPNVKSFQVPENLGTVLAYQKYGPTKPVDAKPAAPDADDDQDQRGARATASRGAIAEFGSPVVLRLLRPGMERTFQDVLEFAFPKNGDPFAFSVAAPKGDGDGVFILNAVGPDILQSAPLTTLVTGKGRYQHLTWTDPATTKFVELAFIGNPAPVDAKKPPYNLYLWQQGRSAATIIPTTTLHAGYVIESHASLTFAKDGSRLFFGSAPPPPPAHAREIDEDKPSFDLWNYKDDALPTIQKVRATADLNRSYRAVYLIPQKKVIQLADETMPELLPNEQGRYALGTADNDYRAMTDYGVRLSDSYLVNVDTGERTLLSKKHEGRMLWSGDGKYALIFDGKAWNTIAVPSGKLTNLTANISANFFDEENDTPSTPGAYGVAGWTRDDKHVLLYDRYDLWQISPDGSSAVNVTQGFGRKNSLELRYVKLDPEAKAIDPTQPLLLHAEHQFTHATGFYSMRLDAKAAPTKLLMADKHFNNPIKAKDANVYLLTGETFTEFPNLLQTDSTFATLTKISDANPQQAQLAWGTNELVSYESLDGIPLQGVLYKPANFDPHKHYPMIVYFYEKLSQNVNSFNVPRPMDSINIPTYVSNGYLVFTPDIVYTTGYPGASALKCVLAGVNAVVAKGFVDEKNIGVQGHSWGGYQIAYLVTQTNRFKAAEDGAPVVDMISAYNGIRWGAGIPRQFQYEKTQSRIGGTPWQYPLRYIENSPIYMVDKVQTPLLILHNDQDDAVPWYQGIEFFLSLRRLGKEAYMFTYNGEPHHLRRRANQKDYAQRMQQFFDYELKAGPKPRWMEKGIPYNHTPEQFNP